MTDSGDAESGPRWPVSETIAPSKVKAFRQCPRKARLMYIDRVYVKEELSLFLKQGLIAHALLARQARLIQAHKPLLTTETMLEDAFSELGTIFTPSDAARHAHAQEILDWVSYGMQQLKPEAFYLYIEEPTQRDYPLPNSLYNFGGRADLVVHWRDTDGTDVVDIVDYKTGRSDYPDELLPIQIGFIYRPAVDSYMRGQPYRYRVLIPWLKERHTDEIELDREYMDTTWPAIRNVYTGLASTTEWPAVTSTLCRYCVYRHEHCSVGKAFLGSDASAESSDAYEPDSD